MIERDLRPRTKALLHAWKELVQMQSSGPGFDLSTPRQSLFVDRVRQFMRQPSTDSFDAIWEPDSAVSYNDPGGPLLRSSFDGNVDDLADFFDTLQTTETYNQRWEDRLNWSWALWELYTRLNDSVPVIITRETADALSWFGVATEKSFRGLRQQVEGFLEYYQSTIGHPSKDTAHEAPLKVELDELFRIIQSVDADAVSSQLKGPHGEFYRHLYGTASTDEGLRTQQVEFVGITPLIEAYAWGKANRAYEDEEKPAYWAGNYWETWKESYAQHIQREVRSEFTLTDLSPDDIGPLFEALTDNEGSNLNKPVATYVMGGQWGQYAWNDVVTHFRDNPVEASQVLSLFFDDSQPAVNRLEAFKEHTLHITNTEGRSPGSLERMATSLLMFTFPETHLGLPPARTKTLLEEKSTLPKYKSGFRPHQYRTIIGPFRGLRDDIQSLLTEKGYDTNVTMLDIHSLIWIYGGEGEPTDKELPPAEWT